MNFITENWAVITTVVLLVLRIAETIAQVTPTTADDNIIGIIKKILANFFKIS